MNREAITALLKPRSVAVLGASPRPGSPGQTTVRNLIDFGYSGRIFPIHPSAAEVEGIACHRNIDELPETPDCAVVALSADKVLSALEPAAARGVRAAVVFASGFAEIGAQGAALQRELQALSRRTGLAVCGPNCLGLANIPGHISMYSAALPEHIRPGGLALVSHSGSGCIVLSNLGRFGFSYLISAGNGAVVDMAEYLEFLADDEQTRVAALFMETLRDPERFAHAAQRMRSAGKPVIVLKIGRSEKGAAATFAHTGALAGSEAAYADFFRSNGVIAVDDLDELAESIALMLSVRKLPRGRGLAIVNVSGGEIALTCDLAQRIGIDLPALSPEVRTRLGAVMPAFGQVANPLDATSVAVFDMDLYRKLIEGLASDPAVAMVAVSQDSPRALGSLQAATYERIARTVAGTAATLDKPLVFYSNVAAGVHPAIAAPLDEAGVPVLAGARASLLAMHRLFDYSARLREPAEAFAVPSAPDPDWRARLATGEPFTEREAKQFLAAGGISVTRERLARTEEEVLAAARALGYPVVLKIESPDLPHKSDAGGVRLDLRTADQVAAAYGEILRAARARAPHARIGGILVQEMVAGGIEAIAGLSRQDPFGTAVVVGSGGVLVELVRDSALALAPFGRGRALELIAGTRLARLLDRYRGRAAGDIEALADLLVKLSLLAAQYGDLIQALDLNPVSVGSKGVTVLDALLEPRKLPAVP